MTVWVVVNDNNCVTDHYVFADGCEEQTEVRTVEEESLFSLAFPGIVQDFHRERAEAQENKMKSTCFHSNQIKLCRCDLFLWVELKLWRSSDLPVRLAARAGERRVFFLCWRTGSKSLSSEESHTRAGASRQLTHTQTLWLPRGVAQKSLSVSPWYHTLLSSTKTIENIPVQLHISEH